MKESGVTITDQFCGAGGSSQGARKVASRIKGIEVKLALNHWKLAIETHNTNFPDTIHDCTDISAADPRRYPSTTILITSPECTNHSLANGKKKVQAQMDLFDKGLLDPAAERSRATMWDVPRFAEYHNYEAIIVENVVDARKWVMFDAWLMAMKALGYNHKCVYINSMHTHPTPQSRDRMYIVFWKKGNNVPDLEFKPKAYCHKCVKDVFSIQTWKNPLKKFGKFKSQYFYSCNECLKPVEPYYYAAYNCIDWSDIGTRIGDRKKPLSANTINRINYGLKKYSNESFFFHTAYGEQARGVARTFDNPTFTQTTFPTQALINPPFIIDDKQSTGIGFRVKGINQQIPTIHTDPRLKLVVPFIIQAEHSNNHKNVRRIDEPVQTQTTRQSMAVVSPWIIEMNRTGEAKPAGENPFSTFTAGGINHALLIENKSFLAYNYNGVQTSHIAEPTDAMTTKDRAALIGMQPRIEDCYYRMLKPHEIQLAMAFEKGYIVLGSGKDQVKQLGNAVTPPAMEWLIERVVKSLEN